MLEFQPRGGGFRVVRHTQAGEVMLASLCTENLVSDSSGNRWVKLPLNECSVHSAIGPMTVKDIEEILVELKRIHS